MGLRRISRRLARWIRGGETATQIFLGCLLGFFVGMMPGSSLLLFLGIFLLVFLNVNRALAMLSTALGKLLCLLLAPVTFKVGYAIIHDMGIEDFFRAAGAAPVAALMNLEVYCVTGGLPFALVLGCVFGWIVVKTIIGVRARIEVAAAGRKIGRISSNVLVRFITWLAFGKRAAAPDTVKKPRLLRLSALVVLVITIALVAATALLAPRFVTRDLLEEQASTAIGAEVNIASLDFSLLGASVEVAGLEATDPREPTRNSVAARELSGDIDPMGFLSERLVLDELVVSGLATGTPRETPGRVLDRKEEAEDEVEKPQQGVWKYFEKTEEIRKYLDYAKKLKAYLDRMKALRERLPAKERNEARKKHLDGLAENEGYLALSARDLVADNPRVVVSRLRIDGIELPGKPGVYALAGQDVSDSPGRHSRPMEISVTEEGGLELFARFAFQEDEGEHRIKLDVPAVSVGEGIRLSEVVPVIVKSAEAAIHAEGVLSADSLHLPVTIHLTDLQTQTRPGKSVLGLDPQTAKQVFDSLKEMTVAVTLTGTLDDPRVELDEQSLLESLRASLLEAGKAELAKQAGKALEELGIKLPDKLPGGLQLPEGLLPGLGDKTEKDEDKEEQKTPKTKPIDLLKELFDHPAPNRQFVRTGDECGMWMDKGREGGGGR